MRDDCQVRLYKLYATNGNKQWQKFKRYRGSNKRSTLMGPSSQFLYTCAKTKVSRRLSLSEWIAERTKAREKKVALSKKIGNSKNKRYIVEPHGGTRVSHVKVSKSPITIRSWKQCKRETELGPDENTGSPSCYVMGSDLCCNGWREIQFEPSEWEFKRGTRDKNCMD